jgi:hypothetical protein
VISGIVVAAVNDMMVIMNAMEVDATNRAGVATMVPLSALCVATPHTLHLHHTLTLLHLPSHLCFANTHLLTHPLFHSPFILV